MSLVQYRLTTFLPTVLSDFHLTSTYFLTDSTSRQNPRSSMIRNSNLYLSTQLESAHLIWIKSNGFFALLEDPAYLVFDGVVQNIDNKSIALMLEKEFKLKEGVDLFIEDIKQLAYSYMYASKKDDDILPLKDNGSYETSFLYTYQIGDKRLCIAINNTSLLAYFHPLISHLQVLSPEIQTPDIKMAIDKNTLSLQKKSGEWVSWLFHNNAYFKGAFYTEMLNHIHEKREEEWMMTLHASGITNGKSAILFSASAGCGKSTIAAYLNANGYDLLSDDFLSLDMGGNVYRFPVAMTVKQGSVKLLSKYYDNLESISQVEGANKKMVKYLPYTIDKNKANFFPVKSIVFVEYSAEKSFSCAELSLDKAIPMLLSEAFVTPNEFHVKAFMMWMNTVQFYQLTYSNSSILPQIISEIYNS